MNLCSHARRLQAQKKLARHPAEVGVGVLGGGFTVSIVYVSDLNS